MAICALASVVSAGTANPPVRYGRLATIGVLIGMAFGIAGFYLLIMLSPVLASLLPPELDRLALVSVRAVFEAVAAAVSALTTALLVTGPGSTPRPASGLVVIGGAFGFLAGIANGAVSMGFMTIEVFPADGPVYDLSTFAMTFVMVTAGLITVKVVADVMLAVAAFRFVRRRWAAAPIASST